MSFKIFTDRGTKVGDYLKTDLIIQGTPAIDEKNMLVVEGKINRTQDPWSFRHKYVLENGEWKLSGIYMKQD